MTSTLIAALGLTPHPEGGWYRELYRSPDRVMAESGSRSAVTTIYYLLERHQLSRWHVVAADEVWHFHGGAPLELFSYDPSASHLKRCVLAPPEAPTPEGGGSDTGAVQVIPRGIWQAARSLGDHSLVGCTVAPGFEFTDFRFVASLPDHAAHFAAVLRHLADLL